jgi:hypothetical protein
MNIKNYDEDESVTYIKFPEDKVIERSILLKRPAKNYSEAVDNNIRKAREFLTDFVQTKIHPDIKTGLSNCTLTASQLVDPKTPISRAASIISNPERYNFREVGEEHAIPGTIVIGSNKDFNSGNNIYHTMWVSGFADRDHVYKYGDKEYFIKKGEPLVSYSKGKNTEDSLVRNIPLMVANTAGNKPFVKYFKPIDKTIMQVELPEVVVTAPNPNGNQESLETERINKGFNSRGYRNVWAPTKTSPRWVGRVNKTIDVIEEEFKNLTKRFK